MVKIEVLPNVFLISVDNNDGITISFKALKGQTRLSGVKLRKVN